MARGHEEHGSLTPFQFTSLIAGTIIGVGPLVLPRWLTETAGHSAPLAMVAGTFVTMALVPIWMKLSNMFPGLTITEYASDIIGTIPGWIVHLFTLSFITVATAMVAREFGEVIVTAVLTETPLEVTTIIMLALAAILVRYDLQVIGRTFEILFPLIVFPGVVISVLSLKNARWSYLFPVWEGFDPFVAGLAFAVGSLEGMLILPLFISSINRSDQAARATLWAVGISGFVYTLVVCAALLVFNVNEMKRLLWPTLELMKTTIIPGNVLERIEAIFLAVWVVAVFTTIAGTFYGVAIGLTKLLKLQDHKTLVPLVAPFLYLIALQPDNILDLYDFLQVWVKLGLVIVIGGPIVLFVAAKLRRLGGASSP